MYLIAHIPLCLSTTEHADAKGYERDWTYSSDMEKTSVA